MPDGEEIGTWYMITLEGYFAPLLAFEQGNLPVHFWWLLSPRPQEATTSPMKKQDFWKWIEDKSRGRTSYSQPLRSSDASR